MTKARDLIGRRYDRLVERRRRESERLDDLGLAAAAALYRRADALVARAFRTERCALPVATAGPGPAIDVVDDLVDYTQLPRDTIERLLVEREPQSFRSEWHATPEPLRSDHWFYLSAKGYLFGNAIHFAGPETVDLVHAVLAPDAHVLDFGGGVGSLALALARRGHPVWVDEISALQRDFLRFRVARHDLAEQVTVLDPWSEVPRRSVDAITAFDVFEHMRDGRRILASRLLPALRGRGLVIEDSPFVQNLANPMHHADWGLGAALAEAGFTVQDARDNIRVWAGSA